MYSSLKEYPQWIIILGAPTRDDGQASTVQKQRCLKAFDCFKNREQCILIPMGAAVANSFVESVTMREQLIGFGVNDHEIIIETRTTSTREQILLLKEWIADYVPEKVLIVSDSMHIPRVKLMLKMAGVTTDNICLEGSGYPSDALKILKRVAYEGLALSQELLNFLFQK